jgi:hypothetical protein
MKIRNLEGHFGPGVMNQAGEERARETEGFHVGT